MLITAYFREPRDGALHGAQSAGAAVLRPLEVGAERVVRPFRDAYAWVHDLFVAKSENERLKRELEQARAELFAVKLQSQDYERLRALVHGLPAFPRDYEPIPTSVIAYPESDFGQYIVIAAGSKHGVRQDAPVISGDGLVGHVTLAARDTSRVMLITDRNSAVAVRDLETNAWGIVKRGKGGPGTLYMMRVPKRQRVYRGDRLATAGSLAGSRYPSLYPRGIPVGVVDSVGHTDTDVYKTILVKPYVDVSPSALDPVVVLRARKPMPRLP